MPRHGFHCTRCVRTDFDYQMVGFVKLQLAAHIAEGPKCDFRRRYFHGGLISNAGVLVSDRKNRVQLGLGRYLKLRLCKLNRPAVVTFLGKHAGLGR